MRGTDSVRSGALSAGTPLDELIYPEAGSAEEPAQAVIGEHHGACSVRCCLECARAPKESDPPSLFRPTLPSQLLGDSASDPASQHDRTCVRSRSVTGPYRRYAVRLRSA